MADAIIACSESLAQQAREFLPRSADRIATVHNGLSIDRMLAEQDRGFSLPYPLNEGQFVLNIAKFETKKGQDVLLRAFHRVAQAYPGLKLVMIGAHGPAKESLSLLVRELGLDSRVFLYEDVPHTRICAFLEAAVLFVLPSRIEPFGIVILEAGAMRVPVIASSTGGVPEIITDGDSGVLVAPDSQAALADKMLELLKDPAKRETLGEVLQKKVMQYFTWKRAYLEYVQIIS